MRDQPLWLVYAPYRVWCPTCGLRVERVPWAEKWQRVTHALARAVATLARKLDWTSVATHFRVNWKTVASVVEATVLWGLAHRRWWPLHVVGIDEVSRRKGQQYLTLVYDLARRRVVWIGKDRDEATLQRFFAWLGWRRARPIRVVCCDMWRPYLAVLRAAVPRATVVFDRFHVTKYATDAVDTVRRQMWRQLAEAEQPDFKRTRFLWLKNPENLRRDERTRLSGLLRLNAPIVKAYLLKEDLRRFWGYRSTAWAEAHLRQWLWRASSQPAGPLHEARQDDPHAPGGDPRLDEAPRDERRPGGHEQQGEGDQSSGVRLPDDVDVYREHLSLLCRTPRTLTLLGREPHFATHDARTDS